MTHIVAVRRQMVNVCLGFYIILEKLPAFGDGEGLGMVMQYFRCAITRVWDVTN